MPIKGIIKTATRKTWTNPKGEVLTYSEITIEGDAKVFSFWEKGINDKMVGDEIEFDATEKDGRWKGKLAGTSKPPFQSRGKSPEELKLQARTMCMAYSKDIVVAMVQKELLPAGKIDDGLKHYAETMLAWVEK